MKSSWLPTPSQFGTEFALWEWADGHTTLWQDYYKGDYESAKENLSVRSGLIQAERLFTHEQLTELYQSVQDTSDGDQPLTDRRCALLEAVQDRIEYTVPELEQRTHASLLEKYGYNIHFGQEPVMEIPAA